MMTKEVAEHLNRLRKLATPIEVLRHDGSTDRMYGTETSHHYANAPFNPARHIVLFGWANGDDRAFNHIADVVEVVLEQFDAAAQDREIRRAATAGDECGSYRITNIHNSAKTIEITTTGYGRELWALAKDSVMAAIAADNKIRTDQYEAYRLACEQGVAVAPQK